MPVVVPALDGVEDRLRLGARVADVGCGSGVALLALAGAFPQSEFEGYDVSRHAIDRAEVRRAESGLANVTFQHAGAADLPAQPMYDLILTLDCIHDMPRPAEAISAIRRAIGSGSPRRREILTEARVPFLVVVGRVPPQPDAGDDVRHFGRDLHVVWAVGAGRGRARDARLRSHAGRDHVP